MPVSSDIFTIDEKSKSMVGEVSTFLSHGGKEITSNIWITSARTGKAKRFLYVGCDTREGEISVFRYRAPKGNALEGWEVVLFND